MAEAGPSPERSPLHIETVRHAEIWDSLQVGDALLARAAMAAFEAAAPAKPASYEVTIVLTDDSEMAELNRLWRGKDSSTNVLSFPAGEPFEADGGEPVPLGDVVLAAETVRAEALQQGIPLPDHVTHLVVHGVLHLLGYDHESDEDATAMETIETGILASLGIADPYDEPVDAPRAELAR